MFYVSGLVLGLAMVLCTQRAVEARTRYVDWALAGFFLGLGWWQSPNILYFFVPTLIWLVIAKHFVPAFPRALVAVPAAMLGALPWIAFGLAHRWPAFPHTSGVHGSYVDHLRFFGEYGFPTALGLRAPYLADWVPDLGHLLVYGAALVALGAAIVLGIRRNRAWGSLALLERAVPVRAGALRVEPRVRQVLRRLPLPVLAERDRAARGSRCWSAGGRWRWACSR